MTATLQSPLSTFNVKQCGDFTPYDGRSLVESSVYTESSYASDPRPSRLYLKSPFKNDSPPQTARTRETSEALDKILRNQAQQFSAICEVWRSKFASSPFIPSIEKPKLPVTRTRATSNALERILARQSVHLTKLGEAWRNKFSSSPSKLSDKKGRSDDIIETSDQDDVDFGKMVEDRFVQSHYELEQRVFRWMDHFPESFDYRVEDIESLDF
ncbi:uncharacterized protein MELLADRAFT_59133 [Melampsora larici-populina 98AG31]|uniref:Uncharacterized protein n=1 Tax=Melampsora larici-populina (strain 98AG31 / pathotype 3-4-7) TaxID=747676 RepID=F4R551_MELLP|nr:uncharacterized protein MELLADRAFT_59133 [Melampsora larici-populina 98AG31]EGG12328.1 hypothetical protein MELLADRAFT_59133 [Melampsora larici-populina 98AG31]